MAEGTYVKLTKDHNSLQDINPGELNQPIDVARVILSSHNLLVCAYKIETFFFKCMHCFFLEIKVTITPTCIHL